MVGNMPIARRTEPAISDASVADPPYRPYLSSLGAWMVSEHFARK